MTSFATPRAAATAQLALPSGDDERVVGFGVMGLPFASGHYLAYRDFPATSFSPGYRSVWHRDPGGVWTFYATTPGPLSCSRYFSSATLVEPVQCGIEVSWTSAWSLVISIVGVVDWRVDIAATRATRLMSAVGTRLPAAAWTNQTALAVIGRAAGPLLRVGTVRLTGVAPNGQRYRIAPKHVWAVAESTAVLRGNDLGSVAPPPVQGRLADFRLPQRGICVVGHGRFETFDPDRHRGDIGRRRISR